MIIVALLFNLFFFIIVVEHTNKFIFILPVYIVLSDALSIIYPLGVKGFHNVLTILVVLFFVYRMIIRKKSLLYFNVWLPILSIYYLFLIFYSSDKFASGIQISQFLIGFYMLPIGFYLIQTKNDVIRLNKSLLYVGLVFVVNFMICFIFKLGDDPYGLGFHGGAMTRESSFFSIIVVLLIPLFLSFKDTIKRVYIIVINFAVVFVLVLLLRRSPVVNIIFGYLIFFLALNYYGKRKKFRNLFLLLLVISTIFLSFDDAKNYFHNKRGLKSTKSMTEQVETESRTLEILYAFDEMITFSDSMKSMLGNEIFNQAANTGRYAHGFFGPSRPMHSTVANIFYGTGLIGTVLFIIMIFDIFRKFLKFNSHIFSYDQKRITICATIVTLFFVLIVNLYTRALFNLSFSIILFLYLGGLLRQLYDYNV